MRRGTRNRLLAMLLGLVASLLMGEAVAGWWTQHWIDDLVGWMHVDVHLHRPSADPTQLYELRPNLSAQSEGGVAVTTNSLGYRDVERSLARPPGVFRILALGGSNTFGAKVDDDGTWPRALEAELTARGCPVEVWNLGVSGYETRQKLVSARRELGRASPDAFLLQVHNIGPRYLLGGHDPWPALRRDVDLIREWTDLPLDPATTRWMARSALLRLVLFTRARQQRVAGPSDPALVSWENGLADLKRFTGSTDVPVVGLVPPPGVYLFTERGLHGTAVGQLQEAGVPVVDLSRRPLPDLPGVDDIHPPPPVHRWYARVLADALLDCPSATCLGGLRCSAPPDAGHSEGSGAPPR